MMPSSLSLPHTCKHFVALAKLKVINETVYRSKFDNQKCVPISRYLLQISISGWPIGNCDVRLSK